MKILKRGINPEDRVYQADCQRCDTRVEFLRSEAKFHSDQRDGYYLSVVCPVCGCPITTLVKNFITDDIDPRTISLG